MPLAPQLLRHARLLVATVLALFGATAHAVGPFITTATVAFWDFDANPRIVEQLKNKGINHITVYVPWSDVEPEKGRFDFSEYDDFISSITRNNVSVIIALDFGGRPARNRDGSLRSTTVLPEWYVRDYPDGLMKDFYGNPTFQPRFNHKPTREVLKEFLASAVVHFNRKHPGKITAYMVGLQDELEIKYGQTGYTWRDYHPQTRAQFRAAHGGEMPVLDYTNEIAQSRPRVEPLLQAHRTFREQQLKTAFCDYAETVRKNKGKVLAYFGETLSSHDAIYVTGIVEEVPECVDIAVIDFNFYDGHKLKADPDVLPMLANYMGNIGYQRILIGAYVEQWEHVGRVDEVQAAVRQSILRGLQQKNVVGYELGGYNHTPRNPTGVSSAESPLPGIDALVPASHVAALAHRARVGVFASKSNFYLWHGEYSNGRNVHQDALTAAYTWLAAQPDMVVDVIGERQLKSPEALQEFDAIVVPHQIGLPAWAKQALREYWKRGGILVQDMRLGEFDETGRPTNDWLHDVFGIQSVEWRTDAANAVLGGFKYALDPTPALYTNFAQLSARPGYRVVAPTTRDRTGGVMVVGSRTLVFGFLPQLSVGPYAQAWKLTFVSSIKGLLLANGKLDKYRARQVALPPRE